MTAKIKLNAASGGGSFSLQAPSSSANNRVFTLPDSADATLLTSTTATGKILQVVHATATSEVSQSFSTDSFADTGLSASITPSSSSNKIFVTGVLSFFADCSANGGFDWNFAICDGSDNILDGTTSSVRGYFVNELYDFAARHPINFLHSPNTASSFTYKIRMNAKSSNVSGGLYAQVNGSGNNISRLTLMEVAA
jgi:hypothetical protein